MASSLDKLISQFPDWQTIQRDPLVAASPDTDLAQLSDQFLQQLKLDQYKSFFGPIGAQLPQKIKERSITVLETPKQRYFLKRTRYNRASVFFRALIKLNFPVFSALIELKNIKTLVSRGFCAPEAVLVGENPQFWQSSSFLLTKDVGGDSVTARLESLSASQAQQLALELGRHFGRLHQNRLIYRDAGGDHIRIRDDGFVFLDCERLLEFDSEPPVRWRAKDLGQLLRTVCWNTGSQCYDAFMTGYGEHVSVSARLSAQIAKRL